LFMLFSIKPNMLSVLTVPVMLNVIAECHSA
jgi:hypothetical protein